MRSVEEHLRLAEQALDGYDRETDPKIKAGFMQLAQEYFAIATERMRAMGIEDISRQAARLADRLNS